MQVRKALEHIENEDVDGLDEIICLMKITRDSGIYNKLKKTFNVNLHLYNLEGVYSGEISPHNDYSKIKPDLGVIIPSGSFLRFSYVQMYTLIELRYGMTVQRKLDNEDLEIIYSSGLDKNLIQGLDEFDNGLEYSEPTLEFFQNLKLVKWEDYETKKFANNLRILKNEFAYPGCSFVKYFPLVDIEDTFVNFIGCCSAVNQERDYLSKEDVLIGYKTSLKLLNTDITQYIVGNTHNEPDCGFLICDNCNGYYKLQIGESPDDFTLECECGGKLKYKEKLTFI
ncbi:hypothetical protein MBMB1_1983 [Methanobacterium sp. MB1]|nr:hypothetical protein MBMB1_1983 [Methanobacterium sp. MB1]